jgi:hypothetical protein
MDEDVDEEMQQLGSSSKPQGVATMPPSWRKSPMVSSRDGSSTKGAVYSSRDGSSNGSKQGQQHLPPGSVVNDIVPLKSKIPGGSAAAAAAEQRKVQQAEQTAKVQ